MSKLRRRHTGHADSEMITREPVANIRGDEWNVVILLFLYLLQGIPLGLSSAIPMLLQTRGASFKQQAEFSFVNWPFSLKLLWAPLVDALYFQRFGRRKTWLVPAQYLIGLSMLFLSFHVNDWLNVTGGPTDVPEDGGDEEVDNNYDDSNSGPQVMLLTIWFCMLNFLAATQDIAVDGWALTMLKRSNVSYASTCNSVGQTMGYFLGYVVFIALESAEFCNNYLRSTPQSEGLVNFPGFLYFWGITYIVATTLIAFFKSEGIEANDIKSNMKAGEAALVSYKQLLNILCLPAVMMLAFLLLTVKIGFAACDAVTSLKLMQGGVPKEKLAILAVPLVPLQIVLPIFLIKFHNVSTPLRLYIKVIPYRLLFNIIAAFFVFLTPHLILGKDIPTFYYVLLLIVLALHQVTMYCMFVEAMAFFAHISDPSVGGTNMTLLNTLNNLGGTWSSTVALWLTDILTWKYCSNSAENSCGDQLSIQECEVNDGQCVTVFDGYYVEMALCTVMGYLWYRRFSRTLKSIQLRPLQDWHVASH